MWIQYSNNINIFLYNRNQPIQVIRTKDIIRKRHDTQEGRTEGKYSKELALKFGGGKKAFKPYRRTKSSNLFKFYSRYADFMFC